MDCVSENFLHEQIHNDWLMKHVITEDDSNWK